MSTVGDRLTIIISVAVYTHSSKDHALYYYYTKLIITASYHSHSGKKICMIFTKLHNRYKNNVLLVCGDDQYQVTDVSTQGNDESSNKSCDSYTVLSLCFGESEFS